MEFGFIEPADHGKISFKDYNRCLDERHVLELERIIKKYGYLTPIIVKIIDGVFYVVDGQHRTEVGLRLRIRIPFFNISHIQEEEIPNVVAKLNTSSKRWRLDDYHQLYLKMKIKAYVDLQKFMDKTSISLRPAIFLHSSSPLKRMIDLKTDTKTFRTGRWEGSEKINVKITVEHLIQIKDLMNNKTLNKSEHFNDALLLIILHPEYNHLKMVATLSHTEYDLTPYAPKNDHFENLAAIYNKTPKDRLKFQYQLAIDGTVCTSNKEAESRSKMYCDLEQFSKMSIYSETTIKNMIRAHQPNKGVPDFKFGGKKYWTYQTAMEFINKKELPLRG